MIFIWLCRNSSVLHTYHFAIFFVLVFFFKLSLVFNEDILSNPIVYFFNLFASSNYSWSNPSNSSDRTLFLTVWLDFFAWFPPELVSTDIPGSTYSWSVSYTETYLFKYSVSTLLNLSAFSMLQTWRAKCHSVISAWPFLMHSLSLLF